MAGKPEAVAPVAEPQQSGQQVDLEKVVFVLRSEAEELRHQNRLMGIALTDANQLAATLRQEIDTLAEQIGFNQGEPETKPTVKANSKNGSKK